MKYLWRSNEQLDRNNFKNRIVIHVIKKKKKKNTTKVVWREKKSEWMENVYEEVMSN